ncbi:MAG: diacylglycerol/lipid kinase family protein [Flammeovirgaceae bacterium]
METSKKSIYFIINPISGTAKKHRLPDLFKQLIDPSLFEWEIKYTDHPHHATEIAQDAVDRDIDYVIAVGGDGTVNETAKALIGSTSKLGIIPLGSGNGLARHLGIPLKPENALKSMLAGNTVKIDTCAVNGQPFFCTSGVGFDALVSHYFAQNKGRGLLNYAKTAIQQYFNYKPATYQITVDGYEYTEQAFVVTLANAAQYGNNAYISPEADISDGLLDLCVVNKFPKLFGVVLIFRSFTGSIHKSKYMKIIRGKHITIRNKGNYAHLDGDPAELAPSLHYSIQQQSLEVLV